MARAKSSAKAKKEELQDKEAQRQLQRQAILTLVDSMHRDKGISKELIFISIEKAILSSIEKNALELHDTLVHIDRVTGDIIAQHGDDLIEPEELGRIAAQSARQAMTQRIREAESDGVYTDFQAKRGELIVATVQRIDRGTAIVSISKDGKNSANTVEAILPRSEQIPGETHQVEDRIKAVVLDVRRTGQRVKIVLSRCHPDFVRSLFEQEIPEIQERTIEIKAVSREAGYRTKVAVSSIDSKVDSVGACVGVRGSRIKNVIDELNNERIDIVRWNDSMQVMIPNALQPAEISEVMLYPRLGRAIVLVAEDQLSLAIGKRGQNVRLASKLVGWDIDIMTVDELERDLLKAERWFSQLPGIEDHMIEALITEGFLSYTDVTFQENYQLAELLGVSEEQAEQMIMFAEEEAERIEREGEPEDEFEMETEATETVAGEESSESTEPEATGIDSLFADDATDTSEPELAEEAAAVEVEIPTGGLDALFADDSNEEANDDASPEAVTEPVGEQQVEVLPESLPDFETIGTEQAEATDLPDLDQVDVSASEETASEPVEEATELPAIDESTELPPEEDPNAPTA